MRYKEYSIQHHGTTSLVTQTLIAANFERYNPNRQDGQVPIRVVPEVIPPPDEKQEKPTTVKFNISSSVEKTYKVLLSGGTNAFINRIKIHKTFFG